MSNEAIQYSMVRRLNDYCFRQIWNEIRATGIANVKLSLYSPRFIIGAISDTFFLSCPTPTDAYAIYYVSQDLFGGALSIPYDQWITEQDAINLWGLMTNVYPLNGKTVSKLLTYFWRDSKTGYLFVAVHKNPLIKAIGLTDYLNLYLSIYLDNSSTGPVHCTSYAIPGDSVSAAPVLVAVTSQINQYKALNTPGTIIIVNGYEQDPTLTAVYGPGDYVDLICDTNVVGGYLVNVSNSTTGYYSSVDSCYREVLHTPKSLNVDNQLITHNTCTFYVRDNTQNRGVLFHRVDPLAVRQITHNDFGLKTTVIQDLRNAMGQDNVSIYARIRKTSTHRLLINDAYFLNILYTASDSDINLFLTNRKNNELDFWGAENLEQNSYIALMFNVPTLSDPSLLGSYVTALGYHEVCSILGAHVQTGGVQNPSGTLFFDKGYGFCYQDSYPLVFQNGRKIASNKITYSNFCSDKIAIGIDSSISQSPPSVITLSLIEGGDGTPTLFQPTSSSTNVTVAWDDVLIYKQVTTTTLTGYQASTTTAWESMTPSGGTLIVTPVTGGTQITCGLSLYGSTLLIKNAHFEKTYLNNIDSMLAARQPLVFNLTEECVNSQSTVVPLMGHNTISAFLNGYRLIENLDFTCIPVTDANENIGFVQVVISNMQYIDLTNTGNIVEIIAHTTDTLTDEVGYVFNGMVSYDDNVNFLYPGMSETYIMGLMDPAPVDKGYYVLPSITVANGSPYEISTSISHTIQEALAPYAGQTNASRIQKINQYYLQTEVAIDTSSIILPGSYKLYSPYITQIVSDVVNGVISIINDPDNAQFMSQFDQYNHLKDRDTAFSVGNLVNKRFVDINPVYGTVTLPIVDYYAPLHRLVQIALGADLDTLGDIVDA